MDIEVTSQIRIQEDQQYWWTVEDFHFDAGGPGFTFSYWERVEGNDKRMASICVPTEIGHEIAKAITALAKKDEEKR